ncbi:CHAP domain-containing protein [Hoyosella sp. YIM 151337]|uniref:CHAP domain-containing protein n=1 Tax=Hoyosella sp. YIM 151337 TaxID=2992742 RepID=UPI002236726D|nr:CHAP domain-containing protein [Hoyosella sp. YIM 151337]MCW4354278.1 CHAP domain-containing protein [Hoyosella sp. YIM 151337]
MRAASADYSASSQRRSQGRKLTFAAALLLTLAILLSLFSYFNLWNMIGPRSFPEVETAQLDERQTAVIDVLRAEFDANPPGEKYSEGSDEAWCANFVSWVMREAGMPFTNPNSGSWRIPGVYTLEEYFRAEGRFRASDSGYAPKPGDVVLYSNRSKFTQHTAIVVRNDDGKLTTVGGNEFFYGTVAARNVNTAHSGIVGYGVL